MEALEHPASSQLRVLAAAHLLEIGGVFLGGQAGGDGGVGRKRRKLDQKMGESGYGEVGQDENSFPAGTAACME